MIVIFSIWKRKEKLEHVLKILNQSQYWAIWRTPNHVLLSQLWQQKFQLKPIENIETVILHLTKDKYNFVIDQINQLDASDFTFDIPFENSFFKLYGHASDSFYVLECFNISDKEEKIDFLEKELEKEKQKCWLFQSIVESFPAMIWSRDPSHQIDYCNKAYADAIDESRERILKEQIEIVTSSHPQSPFHLSNEAVAQGKRMNVSLYTVIRGKRHFLNITETPFPQGSHRTFGYAVDNTILDELKKELASHVRAHQEILHQLSIPIAVFSNSAYLNFYNKAYQFLFGFEEVFLESKPYLFDILDDLRRRQKIPEPPDFLEYKKNQKALFKNLLEPKTDIMHLPNGRVLRCVIAPQPIGGLLYMYEDITDKTYLEREYKILSAVQKETIDHLFEGILVFGSDYRLRFSNPAIESIFGIPHKKRREGTHLNDFVNYTQKSCLNGKTREWLALFEKRLPIAKKVDVESDRAIQFVYSPLPDGSHLLSFIDLSSKKNLLT